MNINGQLSNITDANKHYLRDISDEKNKKKWVDILTKTPNKALEEYHSILCKNNPKNNGYCNLLDLFKILGALEEINKQSDLVKKVKEEHKKEKEVLTTKQNNDLININKAVDELLEYIDTMPSPNVQAGGAKMEAARQQLKGFRRSQQIDNTLNK